MAPELPAISIAEVMVVMNWAAYLNPDHGWSDFAAGFILKMLRTWSRGGAWITPDEDSRD
jgi:hypothetical protein